MLSGGPHNTGSDVLFALERVLIQGTNGQALRKVLGETGLSPEAGRLLVLMPPGRTPFSVVTTRRSSQDIERRVTAANNGLILRAMMGGEGDTVSHRLKVHTVSVLGVSPRTAPGNRHPARYGRPRAADFSDGVDDDESGRKGEVKEQEKEEESPGIRHLVITGYRYLDPLPVPEDGGMESPVQGGGNPLCHPFPPPASSLFGAICCKPFAIQIRFVVLFWHQRLLRAAHTYMKRRQNYKGQLQTLLQNPNGVGLRPENIQYNSRHVTVVHRDGSRHYADAFVCALTIRRMDRSEEVQYVSDHCVRKSSAEQNAAAKALCDQKQMLAVLTGRSRYLASSGDGASPGQANGGDYSNDSFSDDDDPSSSPPPMVASLVPQLGTSPSLVPEAQPLRMSPRKKANHIDIGSSISSSSTSSLTTPKEMRMEAQRLMVQATALLQHADLLELRQRRQHPAIDTDDAV
jgi:hypothetical protein